MKKISNVDTNSSYNIGMINMIFSVHLNEIHLHKSGSQIPGHSIVQCGQIDQILQVFYYWITSKAFSIWKKTLITWQSIWDPNINSKYKSLNNVKDSIWHINLSYNNMMFFKKNQVVKKILTLNCFNLSYFCRSRVL